MQVRDRLSWERNGRVQTELRERKLRVRKRAEKKTEDTKGQRWRRTWLEAGVQERQGEGGHLSLQEGEEGREKQGCGETEHG